MEKPTRKLGRGLGALVPPPSVSIDLTETDRSKMDAFVPLDQVHPSPFQPRRTFDDTTIQGLAESIKRSGLMQPIVVRTRPNGGFELIAGERRCRAARLAGLTQIPAIVRDVGDAEAAELALVENMQRDDLNPMDRGWGLRQLCERFSLSQNEVAARVGLDRSTVTNFIRLTELEPDIATLISDGSLSAGHGRALLSAPAGPARVALAKEAADAGWSVRRMEMATRSAGKTGNRILSEAGEAAAPSRAAVLYDLERQIGQRLGTRVSIRTDRTGAKGSLSIEFYSLDHFDSLLTKLSLGPA